MTLRPYVRLTLDELELGAPGLSTSWGSLLLEASTICMERHQHPQGVALMVEGDVSASCQVFWRSQITAQVQLAWSDEQEATEFGACGIAILIILKLTDFTVIRRARKGEGVDYWLAHKNAALPLDGAARLEVSGIMDGNRSAVRARAGAKLRQVVRTSRIIPTYIVVVEFSAPIAQVTIQ